MCRRLTRFPSLPPPGSFREEWAGRKRCHARTKTHHRWGFSFFSPLLAQNVLHRETLVTPHIFFKPKSLLECNLVYVHRSSSPFFFFSLLFSSAPLKVTENPSCTKDSLPLVRFLHKKRVCPDSLAVLSGIKKTERERKSHKHNVHKSTIFCELRSTVPGAAVLATAKYIYTHVGPARRVLTQSDIKCFSSLQWRSVHTPVVFFSFLPAGFFSRPESLGHRR